jgi:hypothetical protein
MSDNVIIDEVIEIVELDEEETMDIEVSGNRLFFANDILTHNSGYDNADIDLTNTSESIGLPATVDAMFALISTEELEAMGQIMIKQLKNRWNNLSYHRRFVVGIDRSKMRLYDVEEHAQGNVFNEINTSTSISDSKWKPKKKLSVEGLK